MCPAWLPGASYLLWGILSGGAQALHLQASSGFELAGYDFLKVRRHAGLYKNKFAHPEFANTVLVTAANKPYSSVLRNWRCFADKLGLDYIVIALDTEIYQECDKRRCLLIESNGEYFGNQETFRQGRFNAMSCAKVQVVLDIIKSTGLNVVFSDPDNVFRGDPFARGVSLGDKIRSDKYEYIYQQNHNWRNPPNATSIGAKVEEGNTGFYFVSGSRKAKGVQSLFQASLTECKKQGGLDDQANFWQALRNVRDGHGPSAYDADSFKCAILCGQVNSTCSAPGHQVLEYCEMDPWNHATGWEVGAWTGPQNIVTWHGNYVSGLDNKIAKMERNGFWDAACVASAALAAHS